MKYCRYCDQHLPSEAFAKRLASPDGLSLKCRSCASAYNKKRWAEDAEHRDRVKKTAKQWAKKNPERRKEIVQAHAKKTVEKKRATNRASNKRRRMENPEEERLKGRLAAHRRKQRVLKNNSAPHYGVASRLLVRAKGRCTYCEGIFEQLTLDHFHPVSKGGDGSVWNIVPCCLSCNCSKRDKDGPTWIEAKFGIDRLVAVYWRIESLMAARLP